jgi:hypothetical protein
LVVAVAGTLAGCSGGGGGGAHGGGTDTAAVVPGAGQLFLTGQVERFTADDAQTPAPLGTPFTLSATERGVGNATIDNALVGGKRSTISWATGTPLPVTGAGGLDLGAAHVEVDGRGITWGLDGAGRAFVPGAYHAGASVAVGAGGLGAPRDGVDFGADERTVLTSRGGVVCHLGPQRLELQGPGRITVSGRLQVQTPTSRRTVGTLSFGPGPFKVTLSPAGGGLTIDSVLQGTFTAA